MPKVRRFKRAQRGGSGEVTSSVDTVWSPGTTEVVARIVISNQTAPSTCTCAKGIKTLHVLGLGLYAVTDSPPSLSDSAWFRLSSLWWRVLSRPAVRGPEQTDPIQRPACWRKASHCAELHLHPQDRGERRDPPHLLLLSGNRPVERAVSGARGWDTHVARLTGIISDQLCREGTFLDRTAAL